MSEDHVNNLSRRKFLKDATLVTVGGMTAGVMAGYVPNAIAAAAAPQADPTPSAVPAKWDKEADVVVVGFGAAGSAAAMEATKAGSKVLLIERMKNGGGSTAICGGLIYMGGGTPLQKACGFTDTRDDMYKYLIAAVGEGGDTEKIGLYCDKSLELYDWITALGLKYKQTFIDGKYATLPTDDGLQYSGNELIAEFKAVSKPAPRGHHAPLPGSSGAEIFKHLKAGVEAANIETMFETLGKRLIVNAEGRVVGLVVENGGKELAIKANKAVVLTAGTYHANKAMVSQFAPAWAYNDSYVGTPGDDGSGIKMAQAVGADLNHIGGVTGFGGVYLFDPELPKGILVNQAGRRYIGEDGYGSRVGIRIVERYPVSYIITDSAVWDGIPDAVKTTLKDMTVQADSIDKLAAAVKIPPALLVSTVKDYNDMVAAGEDTEYQKDAKYLTPIAKAPFVAIAWGNQMVARQAFGGVMTNVKSQVLDTAGQPIAGLYSAGANTSGIFSRYYPASGSSVGGALTFGRIAGQNGAAEKPWDAA
jgi:3-oxo-5alpha-steroid 4-dehydrogenase